VAAVVVGIAAWKLLRLAWEEFLRGFRTSRRPA